MGNTKQVAWKGPETHAGLFSFCVENSFINWADSEAEVPWSDMLQVYDRDKATSRNGMS